MAPVPELPSLRAALRILRESRERTLELLERVPRGGFTRPGLGGGEWSPKDLVGHLSSWEEYALDALAAWERGARAPIDDLQSRQNTGSTAERRSQGILSVARVRPRTKQPTPELLGY